MLSAPVSHVAPGSVAPSCVLQKHSRTSQFILLTDPIVHGA
jgi:hypothetical protein